MRSCAPLLVYLTQYGIDLHGLRRRGAPFFEYADRWMTGDDSRHRATIRSQIGNDYKGFPQREAWDDLVTSM